MFFPFFSLNARLGAGLVGQKLPGELNPKNAYVCSEYVAKCYEAMGIDLVTDKAGFVAPPDIADDPNVNCFMSLCPDLSS